MLLHFKGDYLLINANAIVNALYCINCTSTTDNLTNKPHSVACCVFCTQQIVDLL
ncbi:hypothetical protein VIVU109784_17555 [Vibrio vulnificus]